MSNMMLDRVAPLVVIIVCLFVIVLMAFGLEKWHLVRWYDVAIAIIFGVALIAFAFSLTWLVKGGNL